MAKTIPETKMLQASDGVTQLNLYTWIPKGLLKKAPTYVVCINHGMAEHALRYDNFAQFLCEKNIAVYAHDQRGHGKTATTESELGFLADANGFQHATEDLRCVLQTARNDFPKAKIILLGHSFGSFVSQSFIEQFGDETDACILSGTAGPRLALTIPGSVIAAIIKKIKGSRYRSKFLDKLTFGSYLNKIPKPCADFAWLSSDAQAVKAYEEDPLCGFLCTAGFFYDITSGLTRIHLQKNIRRIPKNLPIFFFAGTDDPVGSYTATIKNLAAIYRKNEISRVTERYYTDGRHEMLNETIKDDVYNDILQWIESI